MKEDLKSLQQNPALHTDPLKILVVENDPDIREILEILFTDCGFHFRIYEDAEEIIPYVIDFMPNIILLDYMLSRVNGGELCGQVKRHPIFGQIPVVLYSAFPKVFFSLGDYGCDLFIPKPFDLKDLISKILKLAGREMEQESLITGFK